MASSIKIGRYEVGPGHPPFIVAELSCNHDGDRDKAFRIIEAARESGAQAIKLQTYTADTMTIDHDGPDFTIRGGLWDGERLYDLYRKASTPWEWHEALFAHARKLGLEVFSTPFDESAVDFLEQFDPPAYKIASFELQDRALLERVAATGKPVILSTGLADEAEIEEAVATLKKAGEKAGGEEGGKAGKKAGGLVILHCVSGYPTPVAEANLATLVALARKFDLPTGLSDHTRGTVVSITAVALGACFIEKHFTLSRADGGFDAAFSLEPDEFTRLVKESREAFDSLGRAGYGRKESEAVSATYRRSVYVVADMKQGDIFTPESIRRIRPGFGLSPARYKAVLGKKARRDLSRGDALKEEDIE